MDKKMKKVACFLAKSNRFLVSRKECQSLCRQALADEIL
jgi:hypothetical protein